jgi:hypothetical protein
MRHRAEFRVASFIYRRFFYGKATIEARSGVQFRQQCSLVRLSLRPAHLK